MKAQTDSTSSSGKKSKSGMKRNSIFEQTFYQCLRRIYIPANFKQVLWLGKASGHIIEEEEGGFISDNEEYEPNKDHLQLTIISVCGNLMLKKLYVIFQVLTLKSILRHY